MANDTDNEDYLLSLLAGDNPYELMGFAALQKHMGTAAQFARRCVDVAVKDMNSGSILPYDLGYLPKKSEEQMIYARLRELSLDQSPGRLAYTTALDNAFFEISFTRIMDKMPTPQEIAQGLSGRQGVKTKSHMEARVRWLEDELAHAEKAGDPAFAQRLHARIDPLLQAIPESMNALQPSEEQPMRLAAAARREALAHEDPEHFGRDGRALYDDEDPAEADATHDRWRTGAKRQSSGTPDTPDR